MGQLARLFDEQEGMETVEYAVVSGILFIGIVLVISTIATSVQTRFENLQTIIGA